MSHAKWIGGLLGLLSKGPIGALAGFVLGNLFDTLYKDDGFASDTYEQYSNGSYANDGYTDAEANRVSQNTNRNGFLFSLLALSSYIIRADGKIMHSEMETIRRAMRMNFGEAAAVQGEQILRQLFERQKQMDAEQPGAFRSTIFDCCHQLRMVLNTSQRLQLLSLLVSLAKADGNVAPEEITALREVVVELGLSEAELNSMLNLGSTTLADAYAVLEISESATDDEVRAAYKRMVVKHHPDRVASLGDDIRAAAEKKMREINEAKELIYKARGM